MVLSSTNAILPPLISPFVAREGRRPKSILMLITEWISYTLRAWHRPAPTPSCFWVLNMKDSPVIPEHEVDIDGYNGLHELGIFYVSL